MYKLFLYGVMSIVVTTPALFAAQKQKGGSAQLPSRSLPRVGGGLESSASHGNLQEAFLAEAARVKPSDEDLEADFGTGESSRTESLTSTQQSEYDINFDVEALCAHMLPHAETTIAAKKVTLAIQKKLTTDIALLEPTLQRFFATLPPEIRGLQKIFVKKHLIELLKDKYSALSKEELSEEIQKIHATSAKCCVIL